MAKFRKKPVVVEAEQWFPTKKIDGVYVEPEWKNPKGHPPVPERHYVVTIHNQRAYLDAGDWIITESDEVHHYPCKPDEFTRIYEPVQ